MVASLVALRPRSAAAPRSAPAAPPCWPPGALAIAALVPRGCRWPHGEVHEDAFHFCNAPRTRGAYCAIHYGLSAREAGR